jgi:class 3 adenylate cyclase/tetratricopeptide (TPR) repeat protein
MHCGHPTTPADEGRHARIAGAAPAELAHKMRTARVDAERKLVTAVFADVVGSTSLAERMDPEEWIGIMNRAFDLLSGAVYRYEGTVASLVGDGLLAFFGAPVAHEDDPERAVRAALSMQEAIAELGAKLEADRGIEFQIRVGINTGEVVVGRVGSDLRYEYTALGDTMNVAARMQDAAAPGTVMMTAETHRFIGPRFETEDRGEITVKGRARPVHAFRVIAPTASPSPIRGLAGHRSSLVGRDAEMARLDRALAEVRGSGAGLSVVVRGEAGIGKSRLLTEFRARVGEPEDATWAVGQCLSYGHRFPYHLVIDLVRSLIGVPAAADEQQTRTALHDRARAIDDDLFFLEHLLLLPQDSTVARRFDGLDPAGLLADYVRSLERLITEGTHAGPMVVVLEDLHWIDPSSSDLLTRLVRRVEHASVLWIFTTRRQTSVEATALLDAARAAFGDRSDELELTPMSRADGSRIVAELLEVEALPVHVRELILDRADGNPYFVEETIRMLIERGAIERRGGRWIASASIEDVRVPDNLVGLLLARIDALPPDARRTLLVASVIGRTFEERALRRVLEPDEVDLDTLLAAELIERTAPDPEPAHAFRHALLQEAAYGVLLKGERQELHRAVGRVLEEIHVERRDELAAILAHHFERGEDPERALTYLLRAGRHALARYANHEARELLDRAAVLADSADGIDAASRIALDLDRAQAGYAFVPFDETLRLVEGIEPAANELGDPRVLSRLHLLMGRVRSDRGEGYNASEPLRRSLDEALRLGAAIGDDHVRALPLSIVGSARLNAGDYHEAVELLSEAFPLLESFEDHAGAALAGGTLARAHGRLGNFDQARLVGERASALAERSGDANVVLDVLIFLGMVAAERGDLDEAMRLTREGVALADEVGNTYCSLVGNFHLGDQQLRLGRPDDAIASLERSRELAAFCDAGSLVSLSDAWLSAARARGGVPSIDGFDGPLRRARAGDDRYGEALILQLRADARLRLPEPDRAGSVDDLRAAAGLLEDLGALPALARVLLDLGRALAGAGDQEGAEDATRRAEELAASIGVGTAPPAA